MSKAGLLAWIARLKARDLRRTRAQRKMATLALRDREQRLQTILETAVEGIVTIDEHGIIDSFNLAAERIFGYLAAEVVGKSINLLIPPPDHDRHDSYLAEYRRTGVARVIGIGREVSGRRKDGTVFPMDLSVSEVRLADRRLFTGFIRDITERKRLEREVLEISDREQRRIGHDLHDGLCQHLAGIELMSQVLQQRLAPRLKDEAARAGEIARNVREAISHTRQLSRGLSPVTIETDGLASALHEMALNTEKLFKIRCRIESGEPAAIADHAAATHLFRIAQEAVSNAILHGKARQIVIGLDCSGGRVVLRVSDNGSGMPEHLPKVNGMGLRIMQYRAGMVGGTLQLQPNPAGGVSVVCSAPLRAEGN